MMADLISFLDLLVFGLCWFVQIIPGSVWAAMIAVGGGLWGFRNNANAARHQREYELRRDHLLNLASQSTVPVVMFSRLVDENTKVTDVANLMVNMLGDASRASCVAGLITMERSIAAAQSFVTHWFSCLKVRAELDVYGAWRKVSSEESDRLLKEMEIKVDRVSEDEFTRLAEREQQAADRVGRFDKFKLAAFQRLQQLTGVASNDYNSKLIGLQMAIRDELETTRRREGVVAFDRAKYKNMIEAHQELVVTLTDEFLVWQRKVTAEIANGRDPFQGPSIDGDDASRPV